MQYFYIKDKNLFAKGENAFDNYLYIDGEWIKDTERIVSGMLMGYDPTERSGSPYGIGNIEIMDKAEEISEEDFFRKVKTIL